jgi:hypothetical protein
VTDPKPPPDSGWIRTESIGHPRWFNVTAGVLLAALSVLAVSIVLMMWGVL